MILFYLLAADSDTSVRKWLISFLAARFIVWGGGVFANWFEIAEYAGIKKYNSLGNYVILIQFCLDKKEYFIRQYIYSQIMSESALLISLGKKE